MGARRYEELVVWRLADELRRCIHRSTRDGGFERQQWLQAQLRRAAQSACANLAEGFGRYNPRDFARFVRTSRGSLEEIKTHLDEARSLNLITEADAERMKILARRACGAATNFIRYLERAKAPHEPGP